MQVLANLLALAGVCPFVGSISDLIGRRYVAIIGVSLLCIGMIVCSTANTMNVFIGMAPTIFSSYPFYRISCSRLCRIKLGGMAIAGAGAGINELTALAATSEMAPTRKRGKYVAILIFTILPFAASVLWAQLIAYHAGWRYVGLFCGVWSGIGLVVTVLFYHPPPRDNSKDLERKEVIRRIDFVGGFLSVSGMIVFLAGLQWGGYQVCYFLVRSCFSSANDIVRLEHYPRSCAAYSRFLSPRWLRRLGSLLCRIPYLPTPSTAGEAHAGPHSYHNIYLRCELLFPDYVLAHASFQRVRP